MPSAPQSEPLLQNAAGGARVHRPAYRPKEALPLPPGRKKKQSKFCTLLKWLVPVLVNGFCNLLCMIFLRVATYYYIVEMHVMETKTHPYALHKNASSTHSNGLTIGLRSTDLSYGSLEDPVEGMLGHRDIKIHILDLVAMTLPALFLAGTILIKDLHLWTKMLLANAMLAIYKGTLGMVTIVPDSIGWQHCKERLGPENLDYFQGHISSPFKDGFLPFFMDIVKLEYARPGTRFCADMLYSGHTYFTCLYALGLVELARRATLRMAKRRPKLRIALVSILTSAVIGEQLLEIYLVLLDRFHYTMDVIVALLMVFLWYTNGPLTIAAKRWSSYPRAKFGKEQARRIEELRNEIHRLQGEDGHDEGDLWVPLCCVPFCCLWGYHHVVSTEQLGGDLEAVLELPKVSQT